MAGECVTDPGLGGGRISDSMGSGDMESFSDRSRPFRLASCMSSVTSLGGANEENVCLRLPGFTMGDCRTRVEGLVVRKEFLLLVLLSFLPWSFCVMAGSSSISMSASFGEWPVELPEVVLCEMSWACWWLCALRAGEVRGLK
jgi:hypothetical protein